MCVYKNGYIHKILVTLITINIAIILESFLLQFTKYSFNLFLSPLQCGKCNLLFYFGKSSSNVAFIPKDRLPELLLSTKVVRQFYYPKYNLSVLLLIQKCRLPMWETSCSTVRKAGRLTLVLPRARAERRGGFLFLPAKR